MNSTTTTDRAALQAATAACIADARGETEDATVWHRIVMGRTDPESRVAVYRAAARWMEQTGQVDAMEVARRVVEDLSA